MLCILALPRSGSTLTYQSIIHGFDTVYLSNLGNLLYQLPLLGGQLSKIKCKGHNSSFTSSHGFVPGLCGPAEGLKYWSYWAGNHIDERLQGVGETFNIRESYLVKCLKTLGSNKSPVLSGYLGHSLIVEKLQKVFRGAIFVRVKRDPLSNALSILKARRATNNQWFSVFPEECKAVVNKSEHEQVASQVYWLNKRLDEHCMEDKTYWLSYEDLCGNPSFELSKLREFCLGQGIELTTKNSMPKEFKYQLVTPEESDDAMLLSEFLNELEAKHGALR